MFSSNSKQVYGLLLGIEFIDHGKHTDKHVNTSYHNMKFTYLSHTNYLFFYNNCWRDNLVIIFYLSKLLNTILLFIISFH